MRIGKKFWIACLVEEEYYTLFPSPPLWDRVTGIWRMQRKDKRKIPGVTYSMKQLKKWKFNLLPHKDECFEYRNGKLNPQYVRTWIPPEEDDESFLL